MRSKLFYSLIIVVLTSSCVSQRYFVESEYKDQKIKEESLAIIVSDPEIRNEDDINDDFGPGDPDSLFHVLFEKEFYSGTRMYSYLRPFDFDEIDGNFSQVLNVVYFVLPAV